VELVQFRQAFRCRFNYFLLCLKDLPPVRFGQDAHDLAHAPSGCSEDLQAFRSRHEQCDAIVANYAHAFGKTVESLEIKTSEVKTLQLLGRIRQEADPNSLSFCHSEPASAVRNLLLKTPLAALGMTPAGSDARRTASHLIPSQILVIQPFEPLAQLFAGDAIRDIGGNL